MCLETGELLVVATIIIVTQCQCPPPLYLFWPLIHTPPLLTLAALGGGNFSPDNMNFSPIHGNSYPLITSEQELEIFIIHKIYQ